MKLALGQINPTVGDFSGNAGLMAAAARRASQAGASLIAFSELSLGGYPPQDLVEVRAYRDRNESELQRLAAETAPLGIDVICGYVGHAGREGPQIRVRVEDVRAVERFERLVVGRVHGVGLQRQDSS